MNKRAHNKSEAFIWKIFNIMPFILMVLCGINVFINHYKKSVDVETNTVISSEFENYYQVDVSFKALTTLQSVDYIDSFLSIEKSIYLKDNLYVYASVFPYEDGEIVFGVYNDHRDLMFGFIPYYVMTDYGLCNIAIVSDIYEDLNDDYYREDFELTYALYFNERSNNYFIYPYINVYDLYNDVLGIFSYLADDILHEEYYFDASYNGNFEILVPLVLSNSGNPTNEINYNDYSLPQQWIDTCDKYIFKGFNESFNGQLYKPYEALVGAISVSNNSVYSLLKLLYSCCMWFLLIDIIQLCYYLIAFIPKKMCDYIGGK